MTESPFRTTDHNRDDSAEDAPGPARWRVVCGIPLVLLNIAAAAFLLTMTWNAYHEAMSEHVSAKHPVVRDILLCIAAVVSAACVMTSAASAYLRLWLPSSSLWAVSSISAATALTTQIAICLTLFLNPTKSQGCFGGLAALGEALMGLALVIGGVIVFLNTAGLLWLTAAKYRRSGLPTPAEQHGS